MKLRWANLNSNSGDSWDPENESVIHAEPEEQERDVVVQIVVLLPEQLPHAWSKNPGHELKERCRQNTNWSRRAPVASNFNYMEK